MKKMINILLLTLGITFYGCNDSADLSVPNRTQNIVRDDPSKIVFSNEQLQLPGKKGACFTLKEENYQQNMQHVATLNPSWNYSWGSGLAANQLEDVEFIPMTWGSFDPNNITSNILPNVKSGTFKRILGFNEPDGEKQANMSVEKAINLWPSLMNLCIPLGSPAVVDAENGEWLSSFMSEIKRLGYRVDYLCVHNYGGGNAEEFKRKMTEIYNKYKLPIIVSEFAVADWNAKTVAENRHSPAKVLDFMKSVLPWLEETDFIYGYAWFSFGINNANGTSSALFDAAGNLTELGKYYSQFPNNELPPVVTPPTTPVEGTNLLKNPGFESGGEYWTGKDNVNYDNKKNNAAVAGNIISDNATLRFSGVKAWGQVIQKVTVEKGKTYNFGMTGRIQNAVGPSGSASNDKTLTMQVRKDKNNVYGTVIVKVGTNTQVIGSVTIGDNYPDELEIIISKATGIAYVDDVFFTEKK